MEAAITSFLCLMILGHPFWASGLLKRGYGQIRWFQKPLLPDGKCLRRRTPAAFFPALSSWLWVPTANTGKAGSVRVSDSGSSPHMVVDGQVIGSHPPSDITEAYRPYLTESPCRTESQLPSVMAALLTHINWLLSLLCLTSSLPYQCFLVSPPVVGRILASKRCPCLIHSPVTLLPYMAKGTWHMWIKLRISNWNYKPGLFRWAQHNH